MSKKCLKKTKKCLSDEQENEKYIKRKIKNMVAMQNGISFIFTDSKGRVYKAVFPDMDHAEGLGFQTVDKTE